MSSFLSPEHLSLDLCSSRTVLLPLSLPCLLARAAELQAVHCTELHGACKHPAGNAVPQCSASTALCDSHCLHANAWGCCPHLFQDINHFVSFGDSMELQGHLSSEEEVVQEVIRL